MFDNKKIDAFFDDPKSEASGKRNVYRRVKLLLPSVAAVLLGLLILYPNLKEDVSSFKFEITKPKVGEIEKLVVENLNFYVTDEANLVHNFRAAHIEEVDKENKVIKLDTLDAIYNNNDEAWMNLKSDFGYFYQNKNFVKLPDLVEVFYSNGFNLEAVEVFCDFNKNLMYSNSPVTGDGFFGKVDADAFELDTKNEILTFLGNVKIVKRGDK